MYCSLENHTFTYGKDEGKDSIIMGYLTLAASMGAPSRSSSDGSRSNQSQERFSNKEPTSAVSSLHFCIKD